MTKPPAFQFYAKDWLTGTRQLKLPDRGAYIDLLAWSWENGPLPEDTIQIAAIVGASSRDFSAIWRRLSAHWKKTPRGFVNKRLEQERRKQRIYRKLQADKGRAGGRAAATATAALRLQPKGQPKPSSSSALALASEDQDPDQEQRADAQRVLVRLAHLALDAHPADPVEQKEQIKTEAARARIVYDADLVRAALDAAEHQRTNRRVG